MLTGSFELLDTATTIDEEMIEDLIIIKIIQDHHPLQFMVRSKNWFYFYLFGLYNGFYMTVHRSTNYLLFFFYTSHLLLLFSIISRWIGATKTGIETAYGYGADKCIGWDKAIGCNFWCSQTTWGEFVESEARWIKCAC